MPTGGLTQAKLMTLRISVYNKSILIILIKIIIQKTIGNRQDKIIKR